MDLAFGLFDDSHPPTRTPPPPSATAKTITLGSSRRQSSSWHRITHKDAHPEYPTNLRAHIKLLAYFRLTLDRMSTNSNTTAAVVVADATCAAAPAPAPADHEAISTTPPPAASTAAVPENASEVLTSPLPAADNAGGGGSGGAGGGSAELPAPQNAAAVESTRVGGLWTGEPLGKHSTNNRSGRRKVAAATLDIIDAGSYLSAGWFVCRECFCCTQHLHCMPLCTCASPAVRLSVCLCGRDMFELWLLHRAFGVWDTRTDGEVVDIKQAIAQVRRAGDVKKALHAQ